MNTILNRIEYISKYVSRIDIVLGTVVISGVLFIIQKLETDTTY